MLNRFIKTTLLALPALALVGCASAPRLPTYGLDAASASVVHQTCSEVMGLRAGFAEYDACGDTLSQSIRVMNDAKRTSLAHADCAEAGHKLGSPELAKCVVMSKRAAGAASPIPLTTVSSEGLTKTSYFGMSRSQQDERIELSCAQLGLHPATVGFSECVGMMKLQIFQIQNPM